MRVAIVHDWIINIGGAEKSLESIYSLYPSADVFTLVYDDASVEALNIDKRRVVGSFIHKFPFARKIYRNYLPFYPFAVEQFDLSDYDLVISSSHAVAKGALTHSHQLHICYCYTPMRYAWDLYNQYIKEAGLINGLKGRAARLILHYMRIWDYTTANRIDHFIAISKHVAKRIKKVYGRESKIIYPPVDINEFELYSKKEDYYLTVSRMVPYKKIGLIIDAFSQMSDKRLVVIGDGPDFKKVKSRAGKNIEIFGYKSADVVKNYIQKAKAFVFAAEEDLGITPVEAQACGTPVIAYGRGGVLETIIENKTGVFFREQTINGLVDAINNFERIEDSFDCYEIRKNAVRFDKERFKREFREFVEEKIADFSKEN